MKAIAILAWQPQKMATIIVCLIGVLMTGFVDFITGYEVSMFIFYGIPILAAAWFVDKRWAVFISLTAGVVWWWADQMAMHPYRYGWLQAWETGVRLAYFLFVAFSGASLRAYYDSVKSRIQLLEYSTKLEQEIVAISEHEQRRLGYDLHDGICQQLTALRYSASSLLKDLQRAGCGDWASTVRDLADKLKYATAQVRDLSHGLAPVQMEETGLSSALEELSFASTRLLGIDCVFRPSGDVDVLNHNVATNLYRIAQEALNNAVKHSGANRIDLALKGDGSVVEVVVEDDGCGINARDADSTGRGLRIMKYRSRSIGARLEIENRLTGGTAIRCCVRQEMCSSSDNGADH